MPTASGPAIAVPAWSRTWVQSPGHSMAEIDDGVDQRSRDGHLRASGQLQLTVRSLDLGQAVDVELEDLRGVLHAEPITRA